MLVHMHQFTDERQPGFSLMMLIQVLSTHPNARTAGAFRTTSEFILGRHMIKTFPLASASPWALLARRLNYAFLLLTRMHSTHLSALLNESLLESHLDFYLSPPL